jgi:hypothetical protein
MNNVTAVAAVSTAATARLGSDPAVRKSAISSALRQLRQLRQGCLISCGRSADATYEINYVRRLLKPLPTLPALPFSSNIKAILTAACFPLSAESAVATCRRCDSRRGSALPVLPLAGGSNKRQPIPSRHYALSRCVLIRDVARARTSPTIPTWRSIPRQHKVVIPARRMSRQEGQRCLTPLHPAKVTSRGNRQLEPHVPWPTRWRAITQIKNSKPGQSTAGLVEGC